MGKMNYIFAVIALCLMASYLMIAQAPPVKHPMGFFVTSVGLGDGGNLGGLAGADAHCQRLATAVGAGDRTWHAYLSTQGPGAVNARDRIGKGPWYTAKGNQAVAKDLGDLHGDTLDQARNGNNITHVSVMDETGKLNSANPLNAAGQPTTHDILTGSQIDGTAYTDSADHTCHNWTSDTTGSAQVGHSDRTGGGRMSWNSAHGTGGCSQEAVSKGGGAGFFYCFAIN
jgi:hypothetical protein